MGIIAFLFRMILRMTVWTFALVGLGLLISTIVIWQEVRRVYPDTRSLITDLNADVFYSLESLEYDGVSCDDLVANLNRYAALGSGTAYIAALALDEAGDCGDIDGGDAEFGLLMNQVSSRETPDVADRLDYYRSRLLHLSGVTGDTRFWRLYHDLDQCQLLERPPFIFEPDRSRLDDFTSFRDVQLARGEFRNSCAGRLYELGLEYIESNDEHVRNRALGAIIQAERFGSADARWWSSNVAPTLNFEFYDFHVDLVSEPIYPQCSNVGRQNSYTGDAEAIYDRSLIARGQSDATDLWLTTGSPLGDHDFWDCVEESEGRHGANSDRWRGGYDTPFWYAVHAIRTQHEAGLNHLSEIETDIGEACTELAVEIADGLRPIMPGPPVDDPELRQLILSSLTCQPEGLRDPAEYWNNDYSDRLRGQYLPPEVMYMLPSFEPPFRRIAAVNNAEN